MSGPFRYWQRAYGERDLTQLQAHLPAGTLQVVRTGPQRSNDDTLLKTYVDATVRVYMGADSPPPVDWVNRTHAFAAAYIARNNINYFPDIDDDAKNVILQGELQPAIYPSALEPGGESVLWTEPATFASHAERLVKPSGLAGTWINAGVVIRDQGTVFSAAAGHHVTFAAFVRLSTLWSSPVGP